MTQCGLVHPAELPRPKPQIGTTSYQGFPMTTQAQQAIATSITLALGAAALGVGIAKWINYQVRPPKPKPAAYRVPSHRLPSLPK